MVFKNISLPEFVLQTLHIMGKFMSLESSRGKGKVWKVNTGKFMSVESSPGKVWNKLQGRTLNNQTAKLRQHRIIHCTCKMIFLTETGSQNFSNEI